MKEHDEKMAELEIKELKEKAGITKNVRQKRRYDVIRLSLQGYSNNEISKILDISLRQVYNLINLYVTRLKSPSEVSRPGLIHYLMCIFTALFFFLLRSSSIRLHLKLQIPLL